LAVGFAFSRRVDFCVPSFACAFGGRFRIDRYLGPELFAFGFNLYPFLRRIAGGFAEASRIEVA
jgi:hypothetical protein